MKVRALLLFVSLLVASSAATQSRPYEVSIFPVTDCTNHNVSTPPLKVGPQGIQVRPEAVDQSQGNVEQEGVGWRRRGFQQQPKPCRVLVFKYYFKTKYGARRFARGVAHTGLERLTQGTSPGSPGILTIYPTIRKIVVRKIMQSEIPSNINN